MEQRRHPLEQVMRSSEVPGASDDERHRFGAPSIRSVPTVNTIGGARDSSSEAGDSIVRAWNWSDVLGASSVDAWNRIVRAVIAVDEGAECTQSPTGVVRWSTENFRYAV